MNRPKIVDVEFEGIDHSDYPKFVDAFITKAYWENGNELTEDEIDAIDPGDVYELLMEYIF